MTMTDIILYWNEASLEADRVAHTNGKGEQTGPAASTRALAIVHLAMYDAYAGVLGNPTGPTDLSPYLPGLPPAPPGASLEAAVSAAAHAALFSLYPSQRAFFDARHLALGLAGTGNAAGAAFGLLVARRILADRALDPSTSDVGYVPSTAPGSHREDPDNLGQGFYAPFYGNAARNFAVTTRHQLDAPPALGSTEYLAALRQVRAKGIERPSFGALPPGNAPRTTDETIAGLFWAYDGAAQLGTPPRFYNQIVRAVAAKQGNDVSQNARLFALLNTALADAGILAWEQKYRHDLWRPVLGIREHDASLGPAAVGADSVSDESDPEWIPLGAPRSNVLARNNFTPNFPAYPSGHATFGAAALHVTRLFYGVSTPGPDSLCDGIQFVSEELNGITRDREGKQRPRHVRTFPGGLWQMIEENSRSRVFLGVHWIFDGFAPKADDSPDLGRNVGGVPLGLEVAADIFAHGLVRSNVGPLSGGTPPSSSPKLETLRVTVDNLAGPKGGILSRLWFGFHDGSFSVGQIGSPASPGLERMAEDGNSGGLSNEFLAAGAGLVQGTVFGTGVLNLIPPGASATAIVQLDANSSKSRYFSYATMVIPSNDAFVANVNPVAHRVFADDGSFLGLDFVVPGSAVLDAGTEVNDESVINAAGAGPILFADAGATENGVVHVHPGYNAGGPIASNPAFANADFKASGYQVVRIRVTKLP
jgi:hypothetical protein